MSKRNNDVDVGTGGDERVGRKGKEGVAGIYTVWYDI